ncbi:EamA family transporter [Aureisphaera galaxeae]|uniref:EamA family transporter n=1 Tax=Aureisphaera galaxeae TaxID=1538023 RepID=UPI00234FDEB2|nr:EamA family transporter [Aureisphaera galaxeae]MDC8004982.1 EamA family transporter [Aureisphaera galaxeae]
MTPLILSILASTCIFVVFKLFDRFKIHTLQAIVVNYITACITGFIAFNGSPTVESITTAPWFIYTLGLGILFITVFNLMAITTQRSGLSVVSVATKMSVVIPIIFGLVYYRESLGIFKTLGILMALVAVYLTSSKGKGSASLGMKQWLLPALVFLGSGIIDTSIKFLEDAFVSENDVPVFSATIFGAAASVGILTLLYLKLRGKVTFELKNVIGGIALGIPNYFSIYFLVKALRSGLFQSSGIFTVNNVSIVMLSTLVGILLFRERILLKNWLGIFLAVVSIFLVALGQL